MAYDGASTRSHRRSNASMAGRPLSPFTSHDTPAHAVADTFTEPTLDPAHPRDWQTTTGAFSGKVYRQLLGLNPFKSSYLSLYSSLDAWSDKAIAILGALCAIAAGVPLPIISVIFGKLIDTFPPSEDELRQRISELLGVAVGYFVVTSIYAISFGITSEKIAMRLRERLLHCLLHLEQAYLDTHDMDVNSLLTEKIDVIHNGCSEKVGIFIQSLSYFVAAFIVGFILSPKLTGILLAAVIPTMILIVVITSFSISKLSRKAATHLEKANGIVESALRAVRVVQAFDMMTELCEEHATMLTESTRYTIRRAIISAFQMGAIFFTAYAINGLAFYVGSQLAADGQSGGQAGTIFAVVLLILDSSFVVAQFAPFVEIFSRAAAARGELEELFEIQAVPTRSLKESNASPPTSLRDCAVRFENVTFSYPARPTVKALDGLDLVIRPGSFTAIVGTSGGGKSTAISLLAGMYDYSGSICIGSYDIRTLALSELRRHLAIVEQEPILFTGTIFENICNGLLGENVAEQEMRQRCETACKKAAVDFLDQLPDGIDTLIGNELQLSGGQKQRLCLARALIANPAILIADEPTSALDARSEVLVVRALKQAAAAGTTVIMVAHRLSTVLDADSIAVMSDGRVAEQGTPRELSASPSIFQGLLRAQNGNLALQPSSELKGDDDDEKYMPADCESAPELDASSVHDGKEEIESGQERLPLSKIMPRIWQIIRPEIHIILCGVVASMFSGALLIGEAIIFGNLVQLLNRDVHDPDFVERANFFCLMFFVVACVALASWVSSGTAFGVSSTRCVVRVKQSLLETFLYLDLAWFSQKGHSVHQLLSAFTKDTGDLSGLSGPALGTIFNTFTSLIGGITLAHVVAWKIAVVLLSAVPVMLCAGFLRVRVLGAADSRRRTAYTHATSLAAEACRARRTVALLCYEERCLEKYRTALQEPYQKGRWFTAWSNVLLAISFAITYFVYALAYWWGSKQVRNGDYTEKDFFTVLPALLFSSQSAGQLFSLSPEIARAKAACRSIFELLASKPAILAGHHVKSASSSRSSIDSGSPKPWAAGAPHVSFEAAGLSYPGSGGRPALQQASFQIERGMTVAFVGPSGAGKSTTVSLIERFYDATSGTVKIGGIDIRKTDVAQVRDRIGLVSQEPDLLPGSIMHNVRMGGRRGQTVSSADVEAACKSCGLHEFIASLPDGYNTDVGSSGSSKLSGGQRQRLALARALVRDPEMLLLDEPTSALDAHSERQVQEALAQAAQGRTTIMVAHRLASIQHVDRIYVFDDGSVVEDGTHAELVRRGGLYASMAKAQSLI